VPEFPNEHVFQEKIGDQKNARFSRDFKTLADVLIQETVRHDLGKTYPGLADFIFVRDLSGGSPKDHIL
jgi:hypothetical protein